MLEDLSKFKESDDKGALEKAQKELNRQRMREQKLELERKSKELQKLKEKGGAPPGEEAVAAKP